MDVYIRYHRSGLLWKYVRASMSRTVRLRYITKISFSIYISG